MRATNQAGEVCREVWGALEGLRSRRRASTRALRTAVRSQAAKACEAGQKRGVCASVADSSRLHRTALQAITVSDRSIGRRCSRASRMQ